MNKKILISPIILKKGKDHPPKNNKTINVDIKIILEYSPRKNIAKVKAEYSTL
jgi:hypothetical protein